MNLHDPGNAAASTHNRAAWNRLVRHRDRFTRPAGDDEFSRARNRLDADGWLPASLRGQRLLCLAAGGGRHGPLYAAAEAEVTVVDISSAQLELDRSVATERQLTLRTVETSMDDLSMFRQGQFDVVIHPVSTCYLPNLSPMYAEIARVTRPGGIYISQHKQPASLQAESRPRDERYALVEPYYRRDPLPAVEGCLHRESGTMEFIHPWEGLLGLMCRSGFVIEDLTEPRHAQPQAEVGSFAHRSTYLAPYVRVKARRRSATDVSAPLAQPVL